MPTPIKASQLPQIRNALKFYKVSSMITGVFLLLVMATWGLRRLIGFELWAAGPNGLLTLEAYGVEGEGLPTQGLNLTVAILVIHGWLYVAYLFADFRIWTLLRWSFFRFLLIGAGGVVPFLSFFTEHHYAKVAAKDIEKVETELKGGKN
jgi:hypothetical protein